MKSTIDWRKGEIRSTSDLTGDIRLFEIAPSGPFMVPTPGSHINIAVRIGERPETRSYSIVGPCTDGHYRIAVKLLPDTRGGSAYMWSLKPGALVSISTPGNHFELTRGRPGYLLIAGGIGITPIYTMALALLDTQANFRLLYAARSRADLALAGELRDRLGVRLEIFCDEDNQRLNLVAEVSRLAAKGELYICGPIGLLEATKRVWADSGRAPDLLRFETFGNSGRFPTQAFVVKLPGLGREIEVAQNQSMLDALEAAGIDMISDCRRGECGLCALDILDQDGVIDHRDVFFDDAEKAGNHKLCACVSRVAGGSITVDTGYRSLSPVKA